MSQIRIRSVLAKHPDGLTAKNIAQFAGMDANNVRASIKSCFGVYIDRWEGPRQIGRAHV